MEYLFYRLWQLLIGKSEEDMPPFGSMMIFWMLFVFNIRTIELLIHHFYNIGNPLFINSNYLDINL